MYLYFNIFYRTMFIIFIIKSNWVPNTNQSIVLTCSHCHFLLAVRLWLLFPSFFCSLDPPREHRAPARRALPGRVPLASSSARIAAITRVAADGGAVHALRLTNDDVAIVSSIHLKRAVCLAPFPRSLKDLVISRHLAVFVAILFSKKWKRY
jgi:hypothetical protein